VQNTFKFITLNLSQAWVDYSYNIISVVKQQTALTKILRGLDLRGIDENVAFLG
jgi:hypothetical protein|tara:strand:+ start:187 stop:348 length:162 start_codon:yes stop_codon:yes gene_type:complete